MTLPRSRSAWRLSTEHDLKREPGGTSALDLTSQSKKMSCLYPEVEWFLKFVLDIKDLGSSV